jgi:hypothetical protein
LGILLGCIPGLFFWVIADMTSFGDTRGCAQALVQEWVIDFHQWKHCVWEQSVTQLLLLLPGMLQQDKGEFLVTCVVTISSCALPLPQVEFLQLFHL